MKFKILDCTLRDGGYYTNWIFSSSLFQKYLNVIKKLPVDIIEIGYLSDYDKDNNGLFYHLNPFYLKKIKKNLRKNQKLCCMINLKEIKNSKQLLDLVDRYKEYVDIIRFAIDPRKIKFYKNIIDPLKVKFKNISFVINLMYLSTWYKDTKFVSNLINQLKVKFKEIVLVDSYGALKPLETYDFFKKVIIEHKEIKIGCHFHNNCGLALANSLSAIEAGCNTVDSTLKGMGRGAGNAETELLLAVLKFNEVNISGYDFDDLIKEFEKMKYSMNWGSSFPYAYAAIKGFSQSEMMDLIQKRRLDTSIAITTLSSKLKNNKKINFRNLQTLRFLKNLAPILIGGAPSFLEQGEYFLNSINKRVPLILSGSSAFYNYIKLNIKKVRNNVILILSGSEIKKIKNIQSKNFLKKNNINYLIVEKDFFTYELKNIDKNKIVISESVALNPLYLTGNLMKHIKNKNLYVAFFDGDVKTEKGKKVMEETEESIKLLQSSIRISSLTKTYLKVPNINVWSSNKFLYTNKKN